MVYIIFIVYIYTQIQTICLNCFRTIALIPVNLWRLPLPSPMCVKSVHLSGWTDGGARTLYYRGKFHYSRTGNCMAAPCLMIFYISRKYIISSWPSDEHGNKLYTHVISINYIIYIVWGPVPHHGRDVGASVLWLGRRSMQRCLWEHRATAGRSSGRCTSA